MPSYKNEYVITSYSAVKYDTSSKTFSAYSANAKGQITVTANDVIKFLHPRDTTRTIPLTSISIYAITTSLKVQINEDSNNAIYIDEGGAKQIDDIQINSVKFLSSGTVYFEGLTPSGFLPVY